MKEKKKIGRPRAENPMVHTAIVLPPELIARLKGDAEANGHGLSAEIRQRIQLTYLQEGSAKETNRLLKAIRKLADVVVRDQGTQWFEHSYSLATFKAGVAEFLSRYLLHGDEKIHPNGESVDPPEVVGRTYARFIEIEDE